MKKVMESCNYICGFIPDKSISNNYNYKVNEEYLVEIREERMVKMLQKEVFIIFYFYFSIRFLKMKATG